MFADKRFFRLSRMKLERMSRNNPFPKSMHFKNDPFSNIFFVWLKTKIKLDNSNVFN